MKIKALISALLIAVLLAFSTVPVMADLPTPDIVPSLYDVGPPDVVLDVAFSTAAGQPSEIYILENPNDNLEHITVTQAYIAAVHVERIRPGSGNHDVSVLFDVDQVDLVLLEVARLSSSTEFGI